MNNYDYLIVGSGIYGATFAHLAKQDGKKCLVIDKRPHTGGNIHCDVVENIRVHQYGAHIFHTSNADVWRFVSGFVHFNHYVNTPIAISKGKLYNLPFNMNTFHAIWGVKTPDEALSIIEQQRRRAGIAQPRNLEEQAISLVGRDIYELLIKEYTEKQWGRPCNELPAFIIKRLLLRFTFDNNYFNDCYQGIPVEGYNALTDGLLKGIETRTNADYLADRDYWNRQAEKVLFTGPIDAYYQYCFGHLEYRSLRFETYVQQECSNYQGNAVVNYIDADIPYTRIIEHKHFEFGTQPVTVLTKEYPQSGSKQNEPFYPVNDERNSSLLQQYRHLAQQETNVIFGGRLADYAYYDMDKTIEQSIKHYKQLHT